MLPQGANKYEIGSEQWGCAYKETIIFALISESEAEVWWAFFTSNGATEKGGARLGLKRVNYQLMLCYRIVHIYINHSFGTHILGRHLLVLSAWDATYWCLSMCVKEACFSSCWILLLVLVSLPHLLFFAPIALVSYITLDSEGIPKPVEFGVLGSPLNLVGAKVNRPRKVLVKQLVEVCVACWNPRFSTGGPKVEERKGAVVAIVDETRNGNPFCRVIILLLCHNRTVERVTEAM